MSKKKTTDNLYELIQALSKSEKRHFKLYAQRYNQKSKSKKNNTIELFDFIVKLDLYDTNLIQQHFAGKNIAQNLGYEKHRLYQLILESLNDYHRQYSTRVKALHLLQQIEILFGKALYKQVGKLIQKGLKLIKDKNLYDLEYQFNEWVIIFLKQQNKIGGNYDEFGQALTKRIQLLDYIRNEVEYNNIAFNIIELHYEGRTESEEILKKYCEPIFSNPLLSSIDNAITLKAKYAYLSIYVLYEYFSANHKNAVRYSIQLVELFESNPVFLNENLRRYTTVLFNLSFSYIGLKDFDNAQKTIEKYQSLPEVYGKHFKKNEVIYHEQQCIVMELTCYNDFGYFENSLKKIGMVKSKIAQVKEVENMYNYAIMYYMIGLAYFGTNQYIKAEDWIKKYKETFSDKLRQDFQFAMRLFLVLVQIELNNPSTANYYLGNLDYYQRKLGLHKEVEKTIISCLRKITSAMFKSGKEQKRNYKLSFEKMNALNSNSNVYRVFNAWLQSKVNEGESFAQIYQRIFLEI